MVINKRDIAIKKPEYRQLWVFSFRFTSRPSFLSRPNISDRKRFVFFKSQLDWLCIEPIRKKQAFLGSSEGLSRKETTTSISNANKLAFFNIP